MWLMRGYSQRTRIVDTIAIVAFFVLEGYVVYQSIPLMMSAPLISLAIIFVGYVAADFISGMVHWIGDTWGHPDMPLIGNTFIRPFREHHLDQTAITRHDFIETNGLNCLGTIVVFVPTIVICRLLGASMVIDGFLLFAASLTLSVFGTNQFHKWAHAIQAPRLIRWLQSKRIILSPTHHATHHSSPFDRYYCITVGWMNPILERVDFFPRLERAISFITKAIPRNAKHILTEIKSEIHLPKLPRAQRDSSFHSE